MARPKVEQPLVSHGVLAMDIPFDGEKDTEVDSPVIPSSQELMMI